MTAGAEAVDINMNTEQEGVANQVMDEFLPEDLTDQQLGLPVPDAGVGGTDLEDEDQEREHFIKQLEDEVKNFAIAKRIYGLLLTKDDFNLMEKFLSLFKPIKRMSDQLNVGNTTVDLGLSSLSMHSIRDTMGCQDVIHHQHQTLHNILQAVCRPGQVLLLWLVFTLIGMYYD